jgi:hypothetical protein
VDHDFSFSLGARCHRLALPACLAAGADVRGNESQRNKTHGIVPIPLTDIPLTSPRSARIFGRAALRAAAASLFPRALNNPGIARLPNPLRPGVPRAVGSGVSRAGYFVVSFNCQR